MPDNTTTNNTTTNRANVQMCTHCCVAKPVQTPIVHIGSTVACIEVYLLVDAGYYLVLL